jgi:uncharacterized protein YceK
MARPGQHAGTRAGAVFDRYVGTMRRIRFIALFLLIMIVVSACGSSDDETEPTASAAGQDASSDADDPEASDDDEDAETSTSGESDLPASVPEDFPIAIPAGWEVDFNEEIGLTNSSPRLFYASERYDEIVSFYDDWTASQPDDYQRTESDTGITFTRTVAPPYVITIIRDHEERDQTWTLLGASGSS